MKHATFKRAYRMLTITFLLVGTGLPLQASYRRTLTKKNAVRLKATKNSARPKISGRNSVRRAPASKKTARGLQSKQQARRTAATRTRRPARSKAQARKASAHTKLAPAIIQQAPLPTAVPVSQQASNSLHANVPSWAESRPYDSLTDFNALHALFLTIRPSHWSTNYTQEEMSGLDDQKHCQVLTDKSSGVVIGFVLYYVKNTSNGKGYIAYLVVAPSHRKKGGGHYLLKYALEKCRQAGANAVTLSVSIAHGEGKTAQETALRNFFYHLGFVTDTSDANYTHNPNHLVYYF